MLPLRCQLLDVVEPTCFFHLVGFCRARREVYSYAQRTPDRHKISPEDLIVDSLVLGTGGSFLSCWSDSVHGRGFVAGWEEDRIVSLLHKRPGLKAVMTVFRPLRMMKAKRWMLSKTERWLIPKEILANVEGAL